MNQNSCYATPMRSKPFLNNSTSLFHDFVRPSSQNPAKYGSSPFKGSPQAEDLDFIPLSYSSPVTNMNKRGGGNWRANNRKNFSLSNSSNSSFSPYSTNKKHFHSRSTSSNGNSSFSPYNNMDRPRNYYSSNKTRRVGI
jgi:hypothetical protein